MNLPINLVKTMFNARKTHYLLTFFKLKEITSFGQVFSSELGTYSTKIGLSSRSFKNHLLELEKRGFIVKDKFNQNILILKSIYQVERKLSSTCRVVTIPDTIKFLDFSHQSLSGFNALLAEVLIEDICFSKNKKQSSFSEIEDTVINKVESSTTKHVLLERIKSVKESLSKLRFMCKGDFGKSHSEIKPAIEKYTIRLAYLKKDLAEIISKQNKENNSQPALEKVEGASMIFKKQDGLDKELSNAEVGQTFKVNGNNKINDVSYEWSSKTLGRCVTTIIKYRLKLEEQNIASTTKINLGKEYTMQVADNQQVGYFQSFKVIDSTMKAAQMFNEQSENSRIIATSKGFLEVFSCKRKSKFKVKKKKIGFQKYNK